MNCNDQLWEMALLLSESLFVPEHLQGKPNACFALLEIGMREQIRRPMQILQLSYESSAGDLMLQGELVRAGKGLQ